MKRHRFDPFSLLFGAIFLSVGMSFLAGSTIAEAWHGVWPMIAVVVGATLAAWAVAASFRDLRPRSGDEPLPDDPREQETAPAEPSAS
ncbi:MAG: hypothetical protein ACXVWF_05060 [Actinomycetota bacterium]